jgi:heme oxygenase
VTPARQALRQATRTHHDQVEDLLDVHRPLTDRSYARLLGVFLGLFEPAEAALLAGPSGRSASPARARFAAHDLEALAVPAEAIRRLPRATVPVPRSAEAELGLRYVLEGSSLGAVALARRVAHELPRAPSTFLRSARPRHWPRFLEQLEEAEGPTFDLPAATGAAEATFASLVSLAQDPVAAR